MGSQSLVNSRCALVRAPAACGARPPARFTMEEPDVANRHGATARIQNALGSEPLQDEAASSHAQDGRVLRAWAAPAPVCSIRWMIHFAAFASAKDFKTLQPHLDQSEVCEGRSGRSTAAARASQKSRRITRPLVPRVGRGRWCPSRAVIEHQNKLNVR